MAGLFDPITLRGVTARNRAWVSPMCQYSAEDGVPQDWHLVHLGARASGGAGLVMAEATAVSPEGRISPKDTGLWSDRQAEAWARVTAFVEGQGAVPAVQLAHAGRKASTAPPWEGGGVVPPEQGGWAVVGPGPEPFSPASPVPRPLSEPDIAALVRAFADAAVRARDAGFRVVELHMAHGYLLHEFLSPLSNLRQDRWGGDLDGRARLPLEVVRAVRRCLPDAYPVLVRISATDWVDGGWDLEQSVELARRFREEGVDLVDVSSGGLVPYAVIPAGPGFQVPLASAIRARAGIPVGAVGLITQPEQADRLVAEGEADAVLVGRELLRDPHWPLRAARALGAEIQWPRQYLRAR